jgi:hypothetical protein
VVFPMYRTFNRPGTLKRNASYVPYTAPVQRAKTRSGRSRAVRAQVGVSVHLRQRTYSPAHSRADCGTCSDSLHAPLIEHRHVSSMNKSFGDGSSVCWAIHLIRRADDMIAANEALFGSTTYCLASADEHLTRALHPAPQLSAERLGPRPK